MAMLRKRERDVGLVEFLLFLFILANGAISAMAFCMVLSRR